MLTNLMYVTLYVSDQDRALRFYTEQLGLEKRIDYPGPDGRFLTVAAPGSPVEIILWAHGSAAGQPAEVQAGGTPGPVILESDDLREDFKVFRDRGVSFDGEPVDYGFGIRVEALDPDGNQISLRQRAAG
ncbi:catechol 2,3-dioxygenase-like lactoylglutathione lyase family enzyme [Streptomyces sp. 3211.6]|uniref:VOC family protein n=1 Tax=Streptomyces TaxID=1883 RepID=UPI0009A4BAE8|nr:MULTISPECIES: VOC family protein [Streptomyces]RKS97062.1 catechol 2,3-dioxygenase-like lactoylglutathione lyase family enzyme [Streptomyces sp. 3211.6]RPF25425.1 catechol 2,3-dioxygenase-like lactoylglutathione lyase family enzyme [Streptomyces sp. Ag109_G2-6]